MVVLAPTSQRVLHCIHAHTRCISGVRTHRPPTSLTLCICFLLLSYLGYFYHIGDDARAWDKPCAQEFNTHDTYTCLCFV